MLDFKGVLQANWAIQIKKMKVNWNFEGMVFKFMVLQILYILQKQLLNCFGIYEKNQHLPFLVIFNTIFGWNSVYSDQIKGTKIEFAINERRIGSGFFQVKC